MPAKSPEQQAVLVLNEENEITLAELTRSCHVQTEWVLELVEEGVLEPLKPGGPQWRFAATSVVRVQKAHRLQRDLGVNLPGIALALQLLERIDALEARLRSTSERPEPHDAE